MNQTTLTLDAHPLERAFANIVNVDLTTALHIFERGFSEAKARIRTLPKEARARATALFEFTTWTAYSRIPEREILDRPQVVADYLNLRYHNHHQEIFGILCLDSRSCLIEEHELFRGNLERLTTSVRDVFAPALRCDASAVILFHTHPSGDPSPSADDLVYTRRVHEAGRIIGIKLADHIILAGNRRWVSLAARGAW